MKRHSSSKSCRARSFAVFQFFLVNIVYSVCRGRAWEHSTNQTMLRIALQHTVLRAPSHAGCVRRCMGIRSIWRCGSPFEGVGTHRKWRSGEAKAPGNHSAHDALSAPLPHIGSKDSEEAHSGADGGDCSQRPGQSGGVVGIAAKSGVIGTIMGTFGGMVGLGGGAIAIPMLTGWCGLSQHQAIGTSLAAISSTCASL